MVIITKSNTKNKGDKFTSSKIKQIQFSSKIHENDYQYRIKKVKELLAKKIRVICYIQFRGREITHKELGENILLKIKDECSSIARAGAMSSKGKRISITLESK